MFQEKRGEKIKIHILCSTSLLSVAGQATDNKIIGRMRFACWITKATDTHT